MSWLLVVITIKTSFGPVLEPQSIESMYFFPVDSEETCEFAADSITQYTNLGFEIEGRVHQAYCKDNRIPTKPLRP